MYYVYNRVSNIADVASRLARLVPEAEVAFAHGQMKERELEQIMYQFINGDIDVLVSTTIIETGMDISNVNTIIIHDADQMGLSQLYQLRAGWDAQTARPMRSSCTGEIKCSVRWRKSACTPSGIHGAGKRRQNCHARSGDPRRRQPAGRGAARSYGGCRL